MSWKDRNTHFDLESRGPAFPYVQWVNQGNALEPRKALGGFFQPDEQVEALGASIPGEVATLYTKGKQVSGVFCGQLQIAAIVSRFGWKNSAGAFAIGKRPGEDWHGKTQVLSLIRDATGATVGPVVFTFAGWPGSYFQEAWEQHRRSVGAHPESKGSPAWLFFGCYTADCTKMVGRENKSLVTHVAYNALGFDPDVAYIGDEAADRIEAMADEILAWATAWRGESNNGNAPVCESNNGAAPTQATGEELPASPAQWQLIRRLMAEIGIPDEKQDAALRKAGFDPDNLTVSEASEVITRLQAKKNGNGK